jgi:hypothetical protein
VVTRAPWQRWQGCGPLLQAPKGRLGRLGRLCRAWTPADLSRPQQESPTNEENAVIEGLSPDEYEYYYEDLPPNGAPAAAPAPAKP